MKAFALTLALLLALPAGAQQEDAARLEAELTSGKAQVGIPFTLTDPQGRKRSLAGFKGKVVVLYFGFTYCPDVCPTDLLQIARALQSLGPKARDVQVLFVTLDPDRDTPKLLAQYVRAFDKRILALRGSEAEARRIARAYKIYSARAPQPGGNYTIDHSAYTLLLDRDGRFHDYMPPGTPSGRMAVMIEELVTATQETGTDPLFR
ncbi:MAG: SCO family protein [Usitatibacter sp.]